MPVSATRKPIGQVKRWAYGASLAEFRAASPEQILGALTAASQFPVGLDQRDAWLAQVSILKSALLGQPHEGAIYFEYSIPRLGRRADVILLLGHILYVLEFKVGETRFPRNAIDQVWDYALDLKNFHETSHELPIAPILIATEAPNSPISVVATAHGDRLLAPICCNALGLAAAIAGAATAIDGQPIDIASWEAGRYYPTPTIVEAAVALWAGHGVEEISRSDASATNLADTARRIFQIIEDARARKRKAICFVTGVPGAGKTLVGLDVATAHINKDSELYSVFLSGNGPLVAVLRESLARDRVRRSKEEGDAVTMGAARSEVQLFVQNVHHFRDDCLARPDAPPIEHVALFDEAQRAWDLEKTAVFMRTKKNQPGFNQSEPEYLISCMDRHQDWAVIVCLVGSGQEINDGEAGIRNWLEALERRFQNWDVYLSPRLMEIEQESAESLNRVADGRDVEEEPSLHLGVSVRSFRSEHLAGFVNQVLALDSEAARATLRQLEGHYPIRLTRDLAQAKQWLRQQARGTERYGMVVSSQAQRLKPLAIDVRPQINPVHWFLHDRDDVRSSYYLEDAATEFQVQGLELDWACVVWDGDLRMHDRKWAHFSFKGSKWQRVNKQMRQRYLLNAYRVLLTRARQGLVIVVPEGSEHDPTRAPDFYEPTYRYLADLGVPSLEQACACEPDPVTRRPDT